MPFWVATNRQKAPENNAFAKRAQRNRERGNPTKAAPEPVSEPETAPEPSEVADRMPDLQALREAAEQAAALIHAEEVKAVPFERNPDSGQFVQAPDIAAVEAADKLTTLGQEIQPEPEPTKGKRGRKPSPEVQARNARILDIVQEAGAAGISKPDIAKALDGEKEQQVYTSLRQLQGEGKVESKYLDGLGYRWIAS